MLNKKKIMNWLRKRPGYIKKAPIFVQEAIRKTSNAIALIPAIIEAQKEMRASKAFKLPPNIFSGFSNPIIPSSLEDIGKSIANPRPIRRLFFDIEVSPNIVFSWSIGNKIHLSIDNIIKERAIITIAYKWEGEKEIHCLKWDNGDDYKLLFQFSKVIHTADEVVAHNGDSFDIKWIRGRCLKHGIPLRSKINSMDTLKIARKSFRLNSNKLDYIAKFLGVGQKIHTDFDLWKQITLFNDPKALEKMITYNKMDVEVLEKIYYQLIPYAATKKSLAFINN
jgi:DNA polymerase elongation subunit (family B)